MGTYNKKSYEIITLLESYLRDFETTIKPSTKATIAALLNEMKAVGQEENKNKIETDIEMTNVKIS